MKEYFARCFIPEIKMTYQNPQEMLKIQEAQNKSLTNYA